MYEHKKQPLLSKKAFFHRVAVHVLVALALLLTSLGIGIWGYIYFENLAWRDAFLNAAMLLGGMGPVNPPLSNAGKMFAGFYALYAGLVFLITAGIVFTPVLHRIMHKFNLSDR
jgi:hypothetical protein